MPTVDVEFLVVGLACAINKFETQRLGYAWVATDYEGGRVPALLKLHVGDEPHPWENWAEDAEEAVDPGGLKRALGEPLERHVIGRLIFHGRYVAGSGPGERSDPCIDVELSLRPREWDDLRECLSLATAAHAHGPTLSVRVELGREFDPAQIVADPFARSYLVTRYWAEASWGRPGGELGAHPLYRRAVEGGSLFEW